MFVAGRGYINMQRTQQECNIWLHSDFSSSCAFFSGCIEEWLLQSHTTVSGLIELHGFHCFSSQLILSFSLWRMKRTYIPLPNIHVTRFKAHLHTITFHSLAELSASYKIAGYIKTD